MRSKFDAERSTHPVTRLAVATLIVIAAACGDHTLTMPVAAAGDSASLKGTVASVTVDPSSVTANVGDSGQFTAIVKDRYGRLLTNAVSWKSSDTTVVRIRSNGFAIAIGAGSVVITAKSGTHSGISNVTILGQTPPPPPPPAPVVASVAVSPGSASGSVGDSAQFSATARDSSGAEITGHAVTWQSTNTAVVTVSATGMGRGVGGGTAQIVATVDGISGHSDITVAAPAPPPPPPPAAVASVAITPSSATLTTGSSTQLSAATRDSAGNLLSGRAISWASSNNLVATVSSSGAVTALVAGSVTITATSEGASGTASVAVTLLPPPPPPSGTWPAMPSGYSVVTDQPFDPLQVALWQLIWNNNGYGTITTNTTAPLSTSVFQVMYPVGFAAGSAPATQYYPLGGRRNIYVGTWWKANANWQGHESNVNKIQFLFPASGGGDMYMAAYGPPGGPYELRTALQFIGGDTRDWLRPNVSAGNVTMGEWHRLEWIVEYNTSGANGVVRWYIDGTLVGDYRDIVFPAGGFEEYKLSPTWGGMGGITKQQTDYFWFDHVRIASR